MLQHNIVTLKNIFLVAITPLMMSCLSCSKDDDATPSASEPAVQARSAKRGVSFSFQTNDQIDLLAPGTSWSYNWGPTLDKYFETAYSDSKMDFCPMAWNGDYNSAAIREYKTKHPECKYLLAFNEPNLTDQCNYTPAQAAAQWPKLKAFAKELDMKIVSPAMNYGTLSGYGDPIVWLDEFFKLVPKSDMCAIALHCYMGNASSLKSYVERFKKYDLPIWMTEFCAWENFIGSSTAQMYFMSDALNYMECNPDIERYAWFIPCGGSAVNAYPYMYLLNKNKPVGLTDCGKVYVNMSTFDKSIYYVAGQKIPAEHYQNCNMSESLNGGWSESVRLRPTTDNEGVLELTSFNSGKWVEYQVDAKCKNITLRYSTILNCKMVVSINGKEANTIDLASTSGEWATYKTDIDGNNGKQTIRLAVSQGNINLNYLIFE